MDSTPFPRSEETAPSSAVPESWQSAVQAAESCEGTVPFEPVRIAATRPEQVTAEVVSLLTTTAPTAVAGNVLCGLICVAAQWNAVEPTILLTWFACMTLVSGARAAVVHACRRAPEHDIAARSDIWLDRLRLALIATGAMWGLAGIALYPADSFIHEITLTVFLAGVTAAVVISNSADQTGASGFAILTIAPFVLYTQFLAGEGFRVQGALAVVYLGFILFSLHHAAKRARQTIELRLEASAQADALRITTDHYRQLLNHLPVGVLHYDRQLRIVYHNLQLRTILSPRRDSLVGLDLRQFGESPLLSTLREAVFGGAASRCESYHEGVFGEHQGWLSLIATPSVDALGSVVGGVAIVEDITERHTNQEEIHRLVFSDALTGLPNRRLMLERLRQARAACARHQQWGALLFIDLDNFKTLNDTRGHDVGDELLKQVASRLATCVRAADSVARFGGDEFLLLLENLQGGATEVAARAQAVGEKVLGALNQPYQLGPFEHYCSPSVGVTLFNAQSGGEEELLKQADLAMYQAKAAGRNNLRFFDPQWQSAIAQRSALEADLRAALRLRQFVVHFQPIMDAQGRVVAAESLIRWAHQERGIVSPAEFIPVAEETGLIVPLGRWVLEEACGQLARWSRLPDFAQLAITVNVSVRQVRQADFVAIVLDIVRASGADPCRLKLELTESMFVEDVDDTVEKMKVLNRAGIGFSMDDFGTGFSSLSFLKRLPLEQIKIDKSFVTNLEWDETDASICAAIVGLAHNLGVKVVAEGVETEAQHYFLRTVHQCDYLQGYLFSKPASVQDFEDYVMRLAASTR